MSTRPLIVGIGGTMRSGSSVEKALRAALAAAQSTGACVDVALIAGPELAAPMYTPNDPARTPGSRRIVELLRASDGVIIASPCYHGSVSGLIKNALDYTEDLRDDPQPYFSGKAVGLIACAAGPLALGQTLGALRDIVHALRGWPTPMGAGLNVSAPLFDEHGVCVDSHAARQLEIVGRQVVEFAAAMRAVHARSPGGASSADERSIPQTVCVEDRVEKIRRVERGAARATTWGRT